MLCSLKRRYKSIQDDSNQKSFAAHSKSNASRISREKEVIAARAAGFQDTIEALKHSLAESEAKKKADAKIIKEGKALCRDLERENSEIKSDKFELEKSVDILQEKVSHRAVN